MPENAQNEVNRKDTRPDHEFSFPVAFLAEFCIVFPCISGLICFSFSMLMVDDLVWNSDNNEKNRQNDFYGGHVFLKLV